MRLVDRVTLKLNEDVRHTVCQPLSVRGSATEEAGIQVPLGGLQLVVDRQDITAGWLVQYRQRNYEVISVMPYLKSPNPKRDVLICSPVFGDV